MSMGVVAHRPARIAVGVITGIAVILIVAQLVLPSIAARIARDRIGRYGTVHSVSVHAFPAIELLWGRADSASVSAGDLRMSVSQLDGLLPQMSGIRRLEMSADGLRVGQFGLREARVEKRGTALALTGRIDDSDVQDALPAGVQAELVEAAGGGAAVRVSGSIFGVGASVLVALGARDGKVVAQPQGIPFAGLAQLAVFSDPRLYVQSVALLAPSGVGGSYRVELRAKLL